MTMWLRMVMVSLLPKPMSWRRSGSGKVMIMPCSPREVVARDPASVMTTMMTKPMAVITELLRMNC